MDWTPLTQALIGVAAAAVPVIAAKLWAWLEERIKASAVDRLGEAAKRAAGLVYNEMLASPESAEAIQSAKAAALELATEAMSVTMAETVKKLGGSREEVRRLIAGELGRMLAVKPVV